MLAKNKLTKKKSGKNEGNNGFVYTKVQRKTPVHSVVTINHLKRFPSQTGAN